MYTLPVSSSSFLLLLAAAAVLVALQLDVFLNHNPFSVSGNNFNDPHNWNALSQQDTKMSASVSTARAAIRAAFAADAFALPYHWVYDNAILAEKFASADKIETPNKLNEYHKGKTLGEFTHYGDQSLILLESIADKKAFDRADFFAKWQALYANESYIGYRDHATKETLANLQAGKQEPSNSGDISAAARIAPLLLVFNDEESFAKAAVTQAHLTHGDAVLLGATDFIARVTFQVLHLKKKPTEAIRDVLSVASNEDVKKLVQKGLDTEAKDDEESVRSFGEAKTYGTVTVYIGKSCGFSGGLPSVIHFISKYQEHGVKEAVVANVKVGGDQAARGAIIATILAAYKPESVPESWYNDLKQKEKIESLLSNF